jgi:tetratricopeptide (TPR) repeat protein
MFLNKRMIAGAFLLASVLPTTAQSGSQVLECRLASRANAEFAIEICSRIIWDASELLESRSDAARIRGEIQLHNREYDAARRNFLRAIDFDPDNTYAYKGLGDTHRVQGRIAAALDAYGKALAIAPGYMAARESRAVLLEDERKLSEALADWDVLIGLDKWDASYYANRARIHALLGNAKEAEADFRLSRGVFAEFDYSKVPQHPS